MFNFTISDELKFVIKKLLKKDKKKALIIKKKINEIINNDVKTIDRYYNCSYDLKEFKHCHIDKSFVLLFQVIKGDNRIIFARFGHHDDFFRK